MCASTNVFIWTLLHFITPSLCDENVQPGCILISQCPDYCTCSSQIIPHESADIILVNCESKILKKLPLTLPRCAYNTTSHDINRNTTANFNDTNFLYYLSIHHTQIKTVQYRDYLKRTALLDLTYNNINNISGLFQKSLPYLRMLLLSDNKLESIPQDIKNSSLWPSIQAVYLHNNLWSCSCNNQWFTSWLPTQTDKVENLVDIKCASPYHLFRRQVSTLHPIDFDCDTGPSWRAYAIGFGAAGVALYIITVSIMALCVTIRQRKRVTDQSFSNLAATTSA